MSEVLEGQDQAEGVAEDWRSALPTDDLDPDLPPEAQQLTDLEELAEQLAPEEKKRPWLMLRLEGLLARLRPEKPRSILPCVVVTDMEDAFPDSEQGNMAADAYLKSLAARISETVVVPPRGLRITVVNEEHEVVEITGQRK